MPTGPLLLPPSTDSSDFYIIKNYFTGEKYSPAKPLNSKPVKTPYDDMGQLIRSTGNYIENPWNFSESLLKKPVDKESFILKEVEGNDGEIVRSNSVASSSKLDTVSFYVKCKVERKKIKVRVRVSSSHRVRDLKEMVVELSLIHICRCRRYAVCRSRWSP
eukprot:TRINITY_DN15109_c0_g1_i9.p4 TRINITY_DN15109_c0_g1~~TRINITY_DN15109_c0_g1_i9.p4  ORF type:complete len:161 (+),score=41.91 TRINITY_DN15109_c0_g1_i9:768-1250(+)